MEEELEIHVTLSSTRRSVFIHYLTRRTERLKHVPEREDWPSVSRVSARRTIHGGGAVEGR